MSATSIDPNLSFTRTVSRPPIRHRGRKLVKRVVLIAAGLAGLGALGYAWMPRPQPVEVAAIRYLPLEVAISEDGRTRVRERVTLSAPITGVLARIDLEPGAVLEAGQVV